MGAGPGATAGGSSLLDLIEVDLGLLEGERKVEAAVSDIGSSMNGWRVSEINGSAEGYNGNWLQRAAVAKAGIYANDTLEAAYPFGRIDAVGNPLDGSKANYTITFPSGQLPPVNAFWSITMYDGKTQLLIDDPINRYLINAPMLPNLVHSVASGRKPWIASLTPAALLVSKGCICNSFCPRQSGWKRRVPYFRSSFGRPGRMDASAPKLERFE